MPQVTKGPLPLEDVAINYATDLYKRLRCGRGWRKDSFLILRQEYARFAQLGIDDEFVVQTMWEYAQLVEATNQYLRTKQSQSLSTHFHAKACSELTSILRRLKHIAFEVQEKKSMREPFERMMFLINGWKAPEDKARG